MHNARRFRPDLIELRLDFIQSLDFRNLEALENLLEGNEILTIRSKQEGGHLAIPDPDRVGLIRYAISQLRPFMIDIEISTLKKYPFLFQDLKKLNTNLIASFHDLQGGKNEAFLRKKISSAAYDLKSLFAVKIVSRARTLRDNLKVLNLYGESGDDMNSQKTRSKLVAFCLGNLGIPSRILALYLGSPHGYVCLPGEPVASGQLDIETMRKLLKPDAQN